MLRGRTRRALAAILLGCLACVYTAPVFMLVSGSLKPDERVLREASTLQALLPSAVSAQNYHDVFERVPFGRYFLNSLLITLTVVTGGLVINSLAGYACARLRFPGRDALLALVAALMIIPLEAIAVPLFYEVTLLGWRDTYRVQILPFVANAFSIYLFASYFLGLPRELEEAAHLDGAGFVRTYLFIIIPNARPVFATVAVLTFLMQWGMFLWPLMVTSSSRVRPLPLGLASFYTLPPLAWGDIFAFGVMMVAPILVLFVCFQGWFIRGVATTGLRR